MPRPVIKNWRPHGCGRCYEQEMVIEISDQRDGERREDSAEERGGRVLYWREWLERGARWGLLDSKLQRENHEKTPINPWKNQHIDTIWRQETSLGDKKTFIVIRSHHYVVFCGGRETWKQITMMYDSPLWLWTSEDVSFALLILITPGAYQLPTVTEMISIVVRWQ